MARARRKPGASRLRGASTAGVGRRATVSDWRRPRRVGPRHEDVRVSVRAVDIVCGWSDRSSSAVCAGPGLVHRAGF